MFEFKKMLESEANIDTDMRNKLFGASKERRLDLIYEWTKTGKFNKKQFVAAVNTYLLSEDDANGAILPMQRRAM
jgi:hypothetical protein